MAVIEAKFNGTPYAWNPLDPNNWQGGVVPGKNDVARFKRFRTVYSSYENQHMMYNSYDMGPNLIDQQTTTPHHFNHPGGYYTASVWTDMASRWSGVINQRTGSQVGSSYPYGRPNHLDSNARYHEGYYYYNTYANAIGRSGSYNTTTENQWNQLHRNSFDLGNTDRWPNRFFMYSSTYYVYNSNRSNTSFTVDGVTIAEPDGLNGGTYASASRPYGISKEDYLAAGGHQTMIDRLVDLFTGSALHVDQGGRWQIRGPHNGRGISNANDATLNTIQYFTIFTVTGSEYRNASYNSGPSYGGVSNSGNNMTRYDYSSMFRMQHALGYFDGFSGSANSAIDATYPIWFWDEGTGSLKYAHESGSVGSRYISSVFATGSGHFYSFPYSHYYQGVGPGNDVIRFTCEDNYYNYPRKAKVDPNWGVWSTSESVDMPMIAPIGGTSTGGHGSNNIAGGHIPYASNVYSDNIIQRWELTGSQEWEVGRIEMAGFTHLHVKDSASIKLYDLESGTYYPSIDMYDYANRATLLLTDSATLETTSSRTSIVPSYESGIYHRGSYTSVIMSGSANYSSSVVAAAASEGDTTIQITDLQNTFGIGDYITIQSTGSYRIKTVGKDYGLQYAPDLTDSGSWSTSWFTASFDTGSYINAQPAYNQYNSKLKTIAPGSYNKMSGDQVVHADYTHTMETDEIVQIMSMSGDYVTVGKMYGKEGEIQSDQGLYSADLYTETFGEPPNTNYTGNKRVVLVDSLHRNFKTGDKLVISGSAYTVLHSTTFLSQSLFREFTSSNQPPLHEVIDMETSFSASSIWPTTQGTYGITNPSVYFTELFMKERLLVTGSYRGTTGSLAFPDAKIFSSNAAHSYNYGGKTGSNLNPGTGQHHRALQLDATQGYYWYMPHPTQRMDIGTPGSNTYRYHNFYSTQYVSGEYQLLGTDDWQEGEIIVSGSILRNGLFDPTSSVAQYPSSLYGLTWGAITEAGINRKDSYQNNYGDSEVGYQTPYPYNHKLTFSAAGGGRLVKGGNLYATELAMWRNVSGSNQEINYSNPQTPYRYANTLFYPSWMDDQLTVSASLNILPALNNYTASWQPMTASMISQYSQGITGGSTYIKMKLQDGVVKYYLGDGKNDVLVDKFLTDSPRGRISLLLRGYGSIYSVNVKTRWQQLILDTEDSFNYRDRIKEGGLLYNHYAGKETKFVATEVVDAKGFKNLLWDAQYNKAASGSIRPYMYACCYTGTTAGGTSLGTTNGYRYMSDRYSSHATLTPRQAGSNSYWSYGQNSDNYYIIYDFRQPVTFDTIGVIHCKDSHQRETDANNKMNSVQFEVCNDVGVASPAWETVRVSQDDLRQSGGRGDIRFYTFPSGSVSARYVKWKNRGGTRSTDYRYFQFFGAYNFSGSCAESGTLDANSVAGGFADANGGPTASMCQVELANVKNFAVDDYIYFWSKQFLSLGRIWAPRYNATSTGYKNVGSVDGYYNKTTDEKYVLGGFAPIYKITAINGNIVTLDKPITHEHIGAGTMAYKFNRGKIKLIGDRAAPFHLYTYSSDSVTQKLSNVTFLNGGLVNYNANQYAGLRQYEDIGCFQNQESYTWNAKPGFYRNIVSSGLNPQGISSNNFDSRYHNLVFNTLRTYGAVSQYSSRSYLKGRSVHNFNVDLTKSYYGHYVYAGEYYGSGAYNGHATITNNFVYGDYRINLGLTGGVSVIRSRMPWSELSKRITVKNNVIPNGISYDYENPHIYAEAGKPLTDRFIFTKDTQPISTDYTWFFPGFGNSRLRDTTYGKPNIQMAGGSQDSIQKSVGDNPVLVRANQVKRFGNRNYILFGDYYQNAYIVKKQDFNTSGLYEFYLGGDHYANHLAGGAPGSYRPVYCNFTVNKDNTQIRIDFDMIYKTSLQRIYGHAAYSSYDNNDHNWGGENLICIILENTVTREILHIHNLDRSMLDTISMRDIYTLDKGQYSFYIQNRVGYYSPLTYAFDFKDLEFRMVTPDLTDVTIEYNNFDFLKLFDSQTHYSSNDNLAFSESSGRKRVLKQSSDLGGTTNYKFNKIKL